MNGDELNRIAAALESIANALNNGRGPDYRFDLSEYSDFDWSSINAEVVKSDAHGPTHVSWNGYIWQRRAPDNKYGAAIWYSRGTGKGENGDSNYEILIKFQEFKDADPLPRKVLNALKSGHRVIYSDQTDKSNKPPKSYPIDDPRNFSKENNPPKIDYRIYFKEAGAMGFNNEFAKQIAADYAGIERFTSTTDYSKALEILQLIRDKIGVSNAGVILKDLLEQCSGDYGMVLRQLQERAG